MTEIEALVGLNLVMDIGSIRLKRMLEVFGTRRISWRLPGLN